VRDASGGMKPWWMCARPRRKPAPSPEIVRQRQAPGDDIISMLVNSEITDEDGNTMPVSDDRVVAQFRLLSSAGHETVPATSTSLP
jgi:cytochrome P450